MDKDHELTLIQKFHIRAKLADDICIIIPLADVKVFFLFSVIWVYIGGIVDSLFKIFFS